MSRVDQGKGIEPLPLENIKNSPDFEKKEYQRVISKQPVTINISLPPGTTVTISSHSISPIEEQKPSKVTKSFQEEVIRPIKAEDFSEDLVAKPSPEEKKQEPINQELEMKDLEDSGSFQPPMEKENIEEEGEEEEEINGSEPLKTTESEESSDFSDSNQDKSQKEESEPKKKKRHLEPNREALLSIAKSLVSTPDPREKVLQEDPILKRTSVKAEEKGEESSPLNHSVYEELPEE